MNEIAVARRVGWARTAWYGAELGIALAFVYALAFVAYAVARASVSILASGDLAGGLAETLLATWLSLAVASAAVAAICALPAALLGAATALTIRALLPPIATRGPNGAVALGVLVCLGFSLALALLIGGLGVRWTPANAGALTFWLALPLAIYCAAGGLASRQLARMLSPSWSTRLQHA